MILFIIGYVSIHHLEYQIHKGFEIEISPPKSIAPLVLKSKPLKKTVFGYYPHWCGEWYQSLRYDLLNHIAYFGVDLHADGSLGSVPNPSILQNLTNLAHQEGVGVSITAVNFNRDSIEAFLNSAQARRNAINNLISLITRYHLDGVNIDFEFPRSTVRESLVVFMSDLYDAIHNVHPINIVTLATPAVDWWGSFDYQALSQATDGLFIMAYDYYWSGSSYAGPVAPLVSSSLWGPYSDTWTVNDYLTKGAAPEKLILGVPYYGYRWPTVSGDKKSQTTGNGIAFVYATLADSALKYGKLWDDYSKTVWYRKYTTNWYQAWFDDSASLYLKYRLVIDSLLGGAGIWALGYDRDRAELWGALLEAFGSNHRDARFISYSIPDTIFTNETVSVTITIKNTGNILWPDSGSYNPYRLGAGTITNGNPHNNQFQWLNFQFGGYSNGVTDQRAFLGDTVLPDSTTTLSFDIQAPTTGGLYWFEARMVCDGVEWFGAPLSKGIGVAEAGSKTKNKVKVITYDILGRRIKGINRPGIYFQIGDGTKKKIVVIRPEE
ncbi:MAG TPA: hypothetical protein EYP24_01485 [bacterium (Candidatus Stahlbacteria)]|nr:hypothetical protein [Candidatus Stahlbacteria bacterium]